MKINVSSMVLIAALLLPATAAAAPASSGDFETLKTLVGTWQGVNKMGGKEEMMTIVYALTSGGTAISETFMPGTAQQMMTMYHKEGKNVAMTHYCALGNQPHMTLKKSEGKTLYFELSGNRGLSSSQEAHMHSLKMTLVDGDTLKQEWANFEAGKQKEVVSFLLKRK